jgi:hypothetical protein
MQRFEQIYAEHSVRTLDAAGNVTATRQLLQ